MYSEQQQQILLAVANMLDELVEDLRNLGPLGDLEAARLLSGYAKERGYLFRRPLPDDQILDIYGLYGGRARLAVGPAGSHGYNDEW